MSGLRSSGSKHSGRRDGIISKNAALASGSFVDPWGNEFCVLQTEFPELLTRQKPWDDGA